MDGNPQGTPNPFSTSSIDGVRPKTVPAPTAPRTAGQQPIISGASTTENPDPMNRPMEKATEVAVGPAKKKNTGLIVGIAIAVLVLLGGGIAAAIALMGMKNSDPVVAAVEKIMRGEAPENSKIDGDINFTVNNNELPISNIKLSLESNLVAKSMVNDTKATLTVSFDDIGDLTVSLDEIYTGNGDLYLKLGGISDAFNNLGGAYLLGLTNQTSDIVDCAGEENCEVELNEGIDLYNNEQIDLGDTITEVMMASKIFTVIDDQWVRISAEDLSNIPNSLADNDYANCLTGLVGGIKNNSNKIAELYDKYPVISSTTDNVSLNSKSYPVRRMIVNNENLTNYLNAAQGSGMLDAISSCLGINGSVTINNDEVGEAISNLPTIYAEIDNDKNFSRLYMEKDLGEGVNMTADLSFSYPDTVNVFGPSEGEYKDLSVLIQEFILNTYNVNGYEIDNNSNVNETINIDI